MWGHCCLIQRTCSIFTAQTVSTSNVEKITATFFSWLLCISSSITSHSRGQSSGVTIMLPRVLLLLLLLVVL